MDSKQPQVRTLAELVEVQPGAVVSRELVNRPTGTITLFAFDAGEGLSEHTTPYDALVQGIEGEVEVTISGTAYRVGPGQLLLMPAHEPHALKALTRFKMLLTMIRS